MKNEIILSNILIDGIVRLNPQLKNVCIGNGYGTWEQYVLNPTNYGLEKFKCIIIVLDGETLMNTYSDCSRIYDLLVQIERFGKQNKGVKIYISNVNCRLKSVLNYREMIDIESYENMVNKIVYELCDNNSNVFCLNIKKLIAQIGENRAYSKKNEYLSSCPYSIDMMRELAKEIVSVDYFNNKLRKKCLVLDLDNTLWGGVIGEDGKENLKVGNSKEGKQYYDFQKIIKKYVNSGIILAIASKNSEDNVKGIFEELNMPLGEEDFILKKINWQPKSVSIKEICNEINIGMDSVVFVDDSAVEREEVKAHIPMVEVPDFPEDPSNLEEFALSLYSEYFSVDKVLFEDLHKTEMYLANVKRNELKEESIDINSFIKDLEIKLIIKLAEESHIQRISQMTQKTNQFNMTTKRYSEQEITRMLKETSTLVYVCRIIDKYGDNGIASLCILKINDKDAYIDSFLMSCRVMERLIEYDFMRFIENNLYNMGIINLYGEYIPTIKNIPASNFYLSYGFEEMENLQEKIIYRKKVTRKKCSELMTIIYEK